MSRSQSPEKLFVRDLIDSTSDGLRQIAVFRPDRLRRATRAAIDPASPTIMQPRCVRFGCEGCETTVLGKSLSVAGRCYCEQCTKGFYGVYSRKNRALMTVVEAVKNGKRLRKRPSDPRRQEALLKVEVAYKGRVRQLSAANLKTFSEAVNPNNQKIGPSGVHGHHHLDHIVPVSWCWDYHVPEEMAASVENLQVIPWRVNHARNTNFRPDMMIGAPRTLFTDQELRLLSQWYYGGPVIRRPTWGARLGCR